MGLFNFLKKKKNDEKKDVITTNENSDIEYGYTMNYEILSNENGIDLSECQIDNTSICFVLDDNILKIKSTLPLRHSRPVEDKEETTDPDGNVTERIVSKEFTVASLKWSVNIVMKENELIKIVG